MTDTPKASRWKFLPILFKVGAKGLKLLKGLKFILAAGTFAAYTAVFTWKFALLLMVAIGFHESGHVWAMRRCGIATKGFYFLPFLGGAAVADEHFKTQRQNAFIALAGPVWGAGLALATAILNLYFHSPWLGAAAAWMALVNIFNLFPVTPLDGGQVMRTIAFSIHERLGMIFLWCSVALSLVLLVKLQLALMALVLFMGVFDLLIWRRQLKHHRILLERAKRSAEEFDRPELVKRVESEFPTSMTGKEVFFTAAAYVTLTVFLLSIVWFARHTPGGDVAFEVLQDK